MTWEQNRLNGSMDSEDDVANDDSEDELEEEQLGHCVRGCFPLLVPHELHRCYSDGLCCVIRGLGHGNEVEDIETITDIFAQREFFDRIESLSQAINFQPGEQVGVIMTNRDTKLFCVHRLSPWTFVMENLSFQEWS